MNYLKIDKCDYLNGRGVGVVLWLSGCNHHCDGCQNQKSWDINAGQPFDKKTEDELIEHLKLPYISRITFSGGDPLHENNIKDVLNLVNKIRLQLPDKTIWLYTGYTWEEIMKYEFGSEYIKDNNMGYWNCDALRQIIASKCDVLVDGRYEENKRDITLKWAGSRNQRVIDVQQSVKNNNVVLYTT